MYAISKALETNMRLIREGLEIKPQAQRQKALNGQNVRVSTMYILYICARKLQKQLTIYSKLASKYIHSLSVKSKEISNKRYLQIKNRMIGPKFMESVEYFQPFWGIGQMTPHAVRAREK